MAAARAKHSPNISFGDYKAIGEPNVRLGSTELYLQSVIWHVWRIKDVKAARALTWNLNAVEKVKLFGALAPRWIKELHVQVELRAIHNEAERLRIERNHMAHGVWGYVPGKREEMLVFYLRELDRRITPKAIRPTIAAVKQSAADLRDLNVRLKRFHRTFGAPAP